MNKKVFSLFLSIILSFLPITALADFSSGEVPFASNPQNFNVFTIVSDIITKILNLMWVVLVAFAMIMFLVAAFQFLSAQGEPEEIKKARNSLIWGVVGLAVAIIAFSLPRIIVGLFGGG